MQAGSDQLEKGDTAVLKEPWTFLSLFPLTWGSILPHSNKVPEKAAWAAAWSQLCPQQQARQSEQWEWASSGVFCHYFRRGWPAVLLLVHTESSKHKGLAAYKAGGRDPCLSFESKGEAASLLPGPAPLSARRTLSVIEEHWDSLWKSCEAHTNSLLPPNTRSQVLASVSWLRIWQVWHETSQERFSAREEGKIILLQESETCSSQQGGCVLQGDTSSGRNILQLFLQATSGLADVSRVN